MDYTTNLIELRKKVTMEKQGYDDYRDMDLVRQGIKSFEDFLKRID